MSKFFNLQYISLILILLLAAILRFWNLSNVPPSASVDEVSIGYNAYSVLKTGGDEFGRFPLIYQRSFDDYRRSNYLFLDIPFVAVFGLQTISVRLPGVILSLITIWAIYEIVLLLFIKQNKLASFTALTSAFLLAISPWHIYISRMGHESNAYMSFFALGLLFFLQGLKNKNKLFLSAIFLTLSMISYFPGQIFIPLLVLGLIIVFWRLLFKTVVTNKKMLLSFFIFCIILIPILYTVYSPDAISRFNGVQTFSPSVHLELFTSRVLLFNNAVKTHNIFGTIFYNRRLFPVVVFFQGYISHYNPVWLFTNGPSDPFKAPFVGLFYLWELPLILIGIFTVLLSSLFSTKIKKLIFLLFFLSPIPAAVATQTPHANRTYVFVLPLVIFASIGFVYITDKMAKIRIPIFVLFGIAGVMGMISFCKNYFIVFPKNQSSPFSYALSKTIPYVLGEEGKYKKIVFSNTDSLYQSYMIFLYYSRFDPRLYQRLGGTKSGGYAVTHFFAKYEFRPINWQKDRFSVNTLFVGNSYEFPNGLGGQIFTDLNGKGEIKVVSSNK